MTNLSFLSIIYCKCANSCCAANLFLDEPFSVAGSRASACFNTLSVSYKATSANLASGLVAKVLYSFCSGTSTDSGGGAELQAYITSPTATHEAVLYAKGIFD